MFIDTHAHLCDEAFDADRHELACALPQMGVQKVVEIACDPATFLFSLEFAKEHPNVHIAFGIHPEYAHTCTEADFGFLRECLAHEKAVALGEIGLDYHWQPETREQQIEVFKRQLSIAKELDKPVSLHIRDAFGDCMEILEEFGPYKGVMHCFSGSAEIAKRCVSLGYHIAFGGALTFKNNRRGVEAAAAVPLDRLLIETDCPYMAPEPFRGKRCDPSMVGRACEKMAEIKGISLEEMAAITTLNAQKLFGI